MSARIHCEGSAKDVVDAHVGMVMLSGTMSALIQDVEPGNARLLHVLFHECAHPVKLTSRFQMRATLVLFVVMSASISGSGALLRFPRLQRRGLPEVCPMSTPDHAPSSAPFYILDADAPLLPDEEPVPPTRRRGETFAVKPAARRTPLPAFTQAAHDAGLHLLVRPAHAPPLAALLAAEGGPS